MQKIQGDLHILRELSARRVVGELTAQVITAQYDINKYEPMWLRLSAAANQDAVLPDATTLEKGWVITIEASGASAIAVKTYHAVTPVLLQSITAGRAYAFTLLDNAAAAGTWHVNFLEQSDTIPSTRHTSTFDATTSWGAASGGYYTNTITQSTHLRGTSPTVQLFELNGSDYIKLESDQVKVAANGDVSIRVTETPDGRFAGKIILV